MYSVAHRGRPQLNFNSSSCHCGLRDGPLPALITRMKWVVLCFVFDCCTSASGELVTSGLRHLEDSKAPLKHITDFNAALYHVIV